MGCAVRYGFYPVEQYLDGKLGHVFCRLSDSRDRRFEEIHICVIVEGYDRNVFRNLQCSLAYCLQGTESDRVAERENGCRRIVGLKKKFGLQITVLNGKLVSYDPDVFIEPLFSHGFPIASDPFLAWIGGYGSLDARYFLMSHSYEVPCSHKTTLMVVSCDEAQMGVVIVTVNQYYRKIIVVYALYQGAVRSARHGNDSINPSGKEKGCAVVEILFILHRIDDDSRESSAVDLADDYACYVSEIWIGYGWQKKTDCIGLVCAQTLRNERRGIVVFPCILKNFFDSFLADSMLLGISAKYSGNRCNRESCACCNG